MKKIEKAKPGKSAGGSKEDGVEALMRLLIPKEYLEDFEFKGVETSGIYIYLDLEEKRENYRKIPELSSLREEDVVSAGFTSTRTVLCFMYLEKPVYLRLKRRRWKAAKGKETEKKDYRSELSYLPEGANITEEFGAFLKE